MASQIVTQRHLDQVALCLNRELSRPYKQYSDGKAQIGCFHISYAYGGACLHEIVNASGGARDVLSCGHIPKRDLYHQMHAYLRGVQEAFTL
jgi:hypothetical protein